MKLSAQISAFLVLLAGIVFFGFYVDSLDIDTEVRNEYTWTQAGDVRNFSFRVPTGWQIETDAGTTFLSNDETRFVISTLSAAEGTSPSDLVSPSESAELTTLQRGDFPALRVIERLPEGLLVMDVTQLNEEGTAFLGVQSETPLSEDNWERSSQVLDSLLDSLNLEGLEVGAGTVAVGEAPVSVELPDGWAITQQDALALIVQTPAEGEPSAAVQILVRPTEEMGGLLTQAFSPTAAAPLADPFEALQGINTAIPSQGGEVLSEPTDTTVAGLDGQEFAFTFTGGEVHGFLLDGGDGNAILIFAQSFLPAPYSDHAEVIDAIIESIQYPAS